MTPDAQQRAAQHLATHGLYDPRNEHDACGVGLVAAIDGTPQRRVVTLALKALASVMHRGAVSADGKTGDGAGIHLAIPHDFFAEQIARTGHHLKKDEPLAVGMIFLPRTDMGAQERCRILVEREIFKSGYEIYGWRQVLICPGVIGERANAVRPEIEQIMISGKAGEKPEELERNLYLIRRRIEKAVRMEAITNFYICSLSARALIYKGMFLASQLSDFYPELTDARFISPFAIFHQRYSTNTFPTWHLAQPFRILAHNGEINTLKGNVHWMAAHECRFASGALRESLADLTPVLPVQASDSAILDAAFELLVRSGRDLPMVKTLMIPEAWEQASHIPEHHRALYCYAHAVMEPWDGPSAICGYDGRFVLAGLDRNGLRPLRTTQTQDGLLIVGSESGMVDLAAENIQSRGRVGPGEMIAVDLLAGRLYRDHEMKDALASRHDFSAWSQGITHLETVMAAHTASEDAALDDQTLRRCQALFGLSLEDIELILQPMIIDAKEPLGSMGDDTPLAVLSERYRGLHHFFRQDFSQVTNPPIDSLRERRVMSLTTRLGNLGDILAEKAEQCQILQLASPVLTNAAFGALKETLRDELETIDCSFAPPEPGAQEQPLRSGRALELALTRICTQAEDAVRGGCAHLVLSDEAVTRGHLPIPSILACGAVHTHLVRRGLRTFAALHLRSGECLDVHYFAVLIGVGATTVNAYLTQEIIIARWKQGFFDNLSLEDCLARYKKAVDDGLLKVISKMGISVLSSYRGGANFEALGLSRSLVDRYFLGLPSRISGIGLAGLERKLLANYQAAQQNPAAPLAIGGFFRARTQGEQHSWGADIIHLLQRATTKDSYQTYRAFAAKVYNLPPTSLRHLLGFRRSKGARLAITEVETINAIRRRFVTPGMSLGALGPEAHGVLNIAMNRIGAKSDSGEGGEDSRRYTPHANGDNENSAIKQIASGRFGVTAEYLNHCQEIEIKVAQGAKPGEGGQLPAFKVTAEIGRLRHATPGVSLISPPPHHDIYSIEDLAQLIYDLKQINPVARVCVKLVARSGIGTIAAGVAKAGADIILISGHCGGTGASPQTSIKFAGCPWEMGLAEVHQVLTLNDLRQRVRLRTDGGIMTGRDVVIATLLGAEEYGVGTAALVAMGCIMVRQCHSNTCPVGVCVQDPKLRRYFTGTPEKVVNLFSFLAEEVREILAWLGVESLNSIVGRSDFLEQVSRGAPHLDDLDLNPILAMADGLGAPMHCLVAQRNEVPESLDAQILKESAALFSHRERLQLQYNINSAHRSVGARLASLIVRHFGAEGLPEDHLSLRFRGTAGQSFGAFAVRGMKMEVIGDANDYVGKGLSGATLILRPPAPLAEHAGAQTILGNTVLYGATSGRLLAAGQAGERFAVRNSGALAVIEGCGSNGCEYMTGGLAVILGAVGVNFAAGMTGGQAFVYDPENILPERINREHVIFARLPDGQWAQKVKELVTQHHKETHSQLAEALINDWESARPLFWQIVPREMITRLEPAVEFPLPEALSA